MTAQVTGLLTATDAATPLLTWPLPDSPPKLPRAAQRDAGVCLSVGCPGTWHRSIN